MAPVADNAGRSFLRRRPTAGRSSGTRCAGSPGIGLMVAPMELTPLPVVTMVGTPALRRAAERRFLLRCLGDRRRRLPNHRQTIDDRGRIVVIGNTKVDLLWKYAYAKEIELRYTRAYGPGRYDPGYEWGGADYPIGYVRWTEGRNMEAVLRLMAEGKLNVRPLITHRFPIEQAAAAYKVITGKRHEFAVGYDVGFDAQGRLLALKPSLLKINAGELAALGGGASVLELSRQLGLPVAMTGAVDDISSGAQSLRLANGHPLMGKVTATGCAAGAVAAAALAVERDPVVAAAAALSIMAIAGERAAVTAAGPGSFVPAFLDALYGLDAPQIGAHLRLA